jgi:hypothetical protein
MTREVINSIAFSVLFLLIGLGTLTAGVIMLTDRRAPMLGTTGFVIFTLIFALVAAVSFAGAWVVWRYQL